MLFIYICALSVAVAEDTPHAPHEFIRPPKHGEQLRESLLFQSIRDNELEKVRRVLSLGDDPNERSRENETAIEVAIENAAKGGQGLEMLKYLIADKADINALTSKGDTPLTLALKRGLTDVATLLIEQHVDLVREDAEGNVPVAIAVRYHNEVIFDFLVREKAGLDHPNKHGDRPLNYAIRYDNPKMAMKLLLENVTINDLNADRVTALHQAAAKGYFEVVAILVQRGANLNLRAGEGLDTPLHLAAKAADQDSVSYMVRYGGNANIRNGKGDTVLISAMSHPKTTVELVSFLLKNGADATLVNDAGDSALHVAASSGHAETIKQLIRGGADANLKNALGYTPLYVAALHGHLNTVKALLDSGAVVNTSPSPLQGAIKGGNEKVVELLIEKGAVLSE